MSALGEPPLTHDFKWRHFRGEIILWAVRRYFRYGVSHLTPRILNEGRFAASCSMRWVRSD